MFLPVWARFRLILHLTFGANMIRTLFYQTKSKFKNWYWQVTSQKELRRLKAVYPRYMLNLGCGPNGAEGWINLDMAKNSNNIFWRGLNGIPFEDGSVDVIFMEHMFEHLKFDDEAMPLLRECRRCLREGGVLRIIVPDAGRYIRFYGGEWETLAAMRPLEKVEEGWRDVWLKEVYVTQMQLINAVFHQRGQHKYGYDAETLILAMKNAGFKEVAEKSFGDSAISVPTPERKDRAPESLYVEAIV